MLSLYSYMILERIVMVVRGDIEHRALLGIMKVLMKEEVQEKDFLQLQLLWLQKMILG